MISINYDQIYKNWIKPELDKRKLENLIENDFKFTKCLITFPEKSKTIVKFNSEIDLIFKIEAIVKEDKEKGDPIYNDEVNDIVDVVLPTINDQRIPFIYLQFNGSFSKGALYDILFDFSPNHNLSESNQEKSSEIARNSLVKLFRRELRERTIKYILNFKDLLIQNGFWVIPALLPSPLNRIITAIKENDSLKVRKIFIDHCSEDFLKHLIGDWWELKEFGDRKEVIEEAFLCHNNKRFITSISTLLPHLEGIITEFGYSVSDEIPWRQTSKTKKVRDILSKISLSTYEFQSVLYFTFSFLIDGPMLDTFRDWSQKVNVDFPNRHVVGHGKFIKELYTHENSIKIFLLLDTIYWIIKEFTNVNVVEHQEITKNLHKISFLHSKGKFEEGLNEVKEILVHPKFTMEYDFFRHAVYYQMVFYYELERLDEAFELFEKYGIIELSKSLLIPFNIKSLLLAKSGDFEGAFLLIDEVIKTSNGLLEKLDFMDSKAEIFQMEGRYQEAINLYEQILKIMNEELGSKVFVNFEHLTQLKLGICYKEEGDIKRAREHIKEGKRIAEQRNLSKWIKKAENLLIEINESSLNRKL